MTVPPCASRIRLTSASCDRAHAHRRAERPVQRCRRPGGAHLPEVREAPPDLEHLAHQAMRSAHRGQRRAQPLIGTGRALGQRAGHQLRLAGLRLGSPHVRGGRARVPLGIQQHAQQVACRHAVDHAVMNLGDQRPPPLVKPLRDPQLPQRLGPVKLLRHHSADQVAQFLIAARRRQRGIPHVIVKVEARVIDPHRAAQVKRYEQDLLPVARYLRQPRRDRSRNLPRTRCRALEDPHRPDMHVAGRILDVQERGIHVTHRLHDCSLVPVRVRTHEAGITLPAGMSFLPTDLTAGLGSTGNWGSQVLHPG